jgi:hypothetical protein
MTNHHSGPGTAEEIYRILPVLAGLSADDVTTEQDHHTAAGQQSSAAPQPQLSRPLDSFKLSILRLLGVLGEPNPPFGHFAEKGFMRRSASFLRQPNALSGVLA